MLGGQARIKREIKRYNVLNCGRRFGKTDLCQILAGIALMEGLPVGWFAPNYKTLDDAWQEMKRTFAPVIVSANKTAMQMTVSTGGTLDGWTLDHDGAGRSRKYASVIIDEAARVKNLWDAFQFDIRPTLLDLHGRAFFASTPKGLNDFHRLWQMADNDPEWARWRMPTSENPYIPLDEIEKMRSSLPGRVAQQELDAEFLEDGAFFQGVDKACTIEQPDAPEQHAGHRVVGGLDWALSNDFTVMTLYCADCRRVVYWYRANKIDFSLQRQRIVSDLQLWGATILPERNSIGAPNIEALMAAGVYVTKGPDSKPGFLTTAQSKPELINRLAMEIERGNIALPKDYADELRSYEVSFSLSGNPKFNAPTGAHDDRVISAALALEAARARVGFMEM